MEDMFPPARHSNRLSVIPFDFLKDEINIGCGESNQDSEVARSDTSE
jgi:hypothetical protein